MKIGSGYYWVENVLIEAAPKGKNDKNVMNGANWDSIKCYLMPRYPFKRFSSSEDEEKRKRLNPLINSKLLKEENGTFLTTEKGLAYLEKCHEYYNS